MSRVVRIDEEALEVALKYGKNLSLGVMKMEELIGKHEKARRTIREELEVQTARY